MHSSAAPGFRACYPLPTFRDSSIPTRQPRVEQVNRSIRSRRRPAPQCGVTLIELIIVLAIVGILAVLVYPSYRENVERTRRADAKAVLMQNAQMMERIFTENGTYTPGGSNPTIISKSPIDGDEVWYTMSFGTTTAGSFVIEAVPTGVGSEQGKLSIDNTGDRWWDRNENGSFDSGENTWNEH